MISHVLGLAGWEWFKLRGRWMPWILLGIVVVITQLFLWINYVAYHNESLQEVFSGGTATMSLTSEVEGRPPVTVGVNCSDIEYGRLPEDLQLLTASEREDFLNGMEAFASESCGGYQGPGEFREAFVLPGSIGRAIGATSAFGPVLMIVLAASLAGAEYGWGTLRHVLTIGVGRWQLLASKLLLLVLISAVGLLIMSATIAITSLIASAIPPEEAGGLADSGRWSETAAMFGKGIYGLAPYIALGTFLAVLTSSFALGVSISLGYHLIELIVTPFLKLTSSLNWIPDFLLGPSVNIWTQTSTIAEVEVTRDGVLLEPPGTLHAFLVILVYLVVMGAATFWLFQRRDVSGAKGS